MHYVLNPMVAGLTRLGVSVRGSRILAVRGRKSGQWRTTPVDLLTHEGATRYVVAPSGVTQWVRNVRAGCDVELRRGRRREPVVLVEPTEEEKVPVVRAYLRRWKVAVRAFLQGVGPDAPDADLARIAPAHPAFLVSGAKLPPPRQQWSGC
jgi:deazaflavin-dependent oxidoreductase (nitroreductase family)